MSSSRETFWFAHRGTFVKRRFVVFGCACAFVGIDAMAASWMAGAVGSSPKPPEAARTAVTAAKSTLEASNLKPA
jgi:hypothetical protein